MEYLVKYIGGMEKETIEIRLADLLKQALARREALLKELHEVDAEIRAFRKLLPPDSLVEPILDSIKTNEDETKRRKPTEKWLKVLCLLHQGSKTLEELHTESEMANSLERKNFELQLRRYREIELLLKTDGRYRLTSRAKVYVSEYLESNPEFAAILF